MGFFSFFTGKGLSLTEANWESKGGLREQFQKIDFDDDMINRVKLLCQEMKLNQITAQELETTGNFKESSQIYQILKIIRPNSLETRKFFAQAFLQPKLESLGLDKDKQNKITGFYSAGNFDERIGELNLSPETINEIRTYIQREK